MSGDFTCQDSVVPGKCAFYLPLFTRVPTKAKVNCALMSACHGFVYNTGLNLVILKNSMQGNTKYSPGLELYVKNRYYDSLDLTVEECAASIKQVTT